MHLTKLFKKLFKCLSFLFITKINLLSNSTGLKLLQMLYQVQTSKELRDKYSILFVNRLISVFSKLNLTRVIPQAAHITVTHRYSQCCHMTFEAKNHFV